MLHRTVQLLCNPLICNSQGRTAEAATAVTGTNVGPINFTTTVDSFLLGATSTSTRCIISCHSDVTKRQNILALENADKEVWSGFVVDVNRQYGTATA